LWNFSYGKSRNSRGSVLECASPVALFAWLRGEASKSGGGPPHSKTLPRKTDTAD